MWFEPSLEGRWDLVEVEMEMEIEMEIYRER